MTYWFALLLMLVGVFGHFVAKLSALEEEGQTPRPGHYLRSHPWRLLNMLIACAILLLLFQELDQLNAVTAILTGYTCQSANDNLRKRAKNRLRSIPEEKP